jgi:hypothetical protein
VGGAQAFCVDGVPPACEQYLELSPSELAKISGEITQVYPADHAVVRRYVQVGKWI